MINNFLLPALYAVSSVFLFSGDPPEPTATSGPPPPGLVVPIDESIAFLAAAGLILGVSCVRRNK